MAVSSLAPPAAVWSSSDRQVVLKLRPFMVGVIVLFLPGWLAALMRSCEVIAKVRTFEAKQPQVVNRCDASVV